MVQKFAAEFDKMKDLALKIYDSSRFYNRDEQAVIYKIYMQLITRMAENNSRNNIEGFCWERDNEYSCIHISIASSVVDLVVKNRYFAIEHMLELGYRLRSATEKTGTKSERFFHRTL